MVGITDVEEAVISATSATDTDILRENAKRKRIAGRNVYWISSFPDQLKHRHKFAVSTLKVLENEERCYHCNEVGHIARDCTQSPSEPSCYNCNKTGHIARNCPEGSMKSCYVCGKTGHISRYCDQSDR
ncbi:hypothetical protein RUM43_004891 [Polyplax serrata]|uniref:CCHC-type domain-containing protein n=1 Tax=Polyplax serrata TaxID=468196 RepID=A0AAN8SC80_POLSC